MTVSSVFKRYFFSTSWLLSERLFRMGLGFFVTILVARHLEPAGFGRVTYALSFVSLFVPVASLGLRMVTVREIVRHPGEQSEIVGTALGLRLASGLILVPAVCAAAFALSQDRIANLLVAVFAFSILFRASGVLSDYFQAHVLGKHIVAGMSISLVLSSLVTALFVAADFNTAWFTLPKLLEQLLLAMILAYLFRSVSRGEMRLRFSPSMAKRLLKASWPLIFSALFISIYMRIDQVMIKLMLENRSAEKVGYYGAAVRITEVWYFIPTTVAGSLFPALLAARKAGGRRYEQFLQTWYTCMTWGGVAIGALVTTVAPWLIPFVFGASYTEAVPVAVLYAWAAVFVSQGVARSRWLGAEDLQAFNAFFAGGSALLNVVLNLILIPVLGIIGAAVATVVCQGSSVLIFPLFLQRTRPSSCALVRSFNIFRLPALLRDWRRGP